MFTLNVEVDTSTPPEIEAGIRLYWELNEAGKFAHKAPAIAEQMGLNGSSTLLQLVNTHSETWSPQITCPVCKSPLVIANRSTFNEFKRNPGGYTCSECHALRVEAAAKAKAEAEVNLRAQVDDHLADMRAAMPEFEPEQLNLRAAVCLLSLVRGGMDEAYTVIDSVVNFTTPLAPTPDLTVSILKFSYGLLIVPSPQNPLSVYFFDDGILDKGSLKIESTLWSFGPRDTPAKALAFMKELERRFTAMDWPEHWLEQSQPLWREVAAHECIEYLLEQAQEHGIHGVPGEKTTEVFMTLLDTFSTAQIYNHIWGAVRNTAAFVARTRAGQKHAWNYLVAAVASRGERARLEGWDVKPYRRSRNHPQSVISQVLFNTVLQTNGFDVKPT